MQIDTSIESFINEGQIRLVNTTRQLEKGHVNFVPSGFDKTLLESMLALNRRVIEALKINRGITHLEVYPGDSDLLFGEITLRRAGRGDTRWGPGQTTCRNARVPPQGPALGKHPPAGKRRTGYRLPVVQLRHSSRTA